jgi:hypothetical protein
MLAKTVKPATAWREANCSRDNRNITASTLEGRPAAARMPERRLINNITSNQPTTLVFLRKFCNVVRTAKNS